MNEANIKTSGWLKLDITPDSKQAFLSVVPPQTEEGDWPNLQKAKELVRQEAIIYGVFEDEIRRVVEERIPEPTLIAQGDDPIPGEDAFLSFTFPTGRKSSLPKELEDGRVDFREISTIYNVQKDQVLVTKTPATKGECGKDIRGREIQPKPGKDKTLVMGKNVAWTPDGLSVIATADGEPTLAGNRLSVLSVYEVPGGVNFRSGNIDFLGNVVVRGNVENGFTVKAEGDVTVFGNVEAGMVTCGGNLLVVGGIVGQDKTVVKCQGNVTAHYIERATVEAGGDMNVRDAIMHSRVSSGNQILLQGRKGLIVGGLCRAGEGIEARVIGSRLGTQTEIEVGVNPKARTEMLQIEEELKECNENLNKSSKVLQLLGKEGSQSTPERIQMKEKLAKTAMALTQRIKELESRRRELAEEIQARFQERGRIQVREMIYPGVRVTIGKATRLFRDETKYALLVYQEGEVTVQNFR
jgi:uncharacterized protein (DUF342 family)